MSESSRPFSVSSDGKINDPVFGPIWIKETTGLTSSTKTLKGKYCDKFFTWLEVDMWGKAWMCCPSWLPYPIGNVLTDSIDEIWNGERAQTLRKQMFTDEWKYCHHELCPLIAADLLPNIDDVDIDKGYSVGEIEAVKTRSTYARQLPTKINFSNDESCNLKCPSCRVDKLLFTEGPLYERRKTVNDKLYEMLFSTPSDRDFSIHVTGSGDPFASKIYRDMLSLIDGEQFPNLKVYLQTNGVMFTPKMWNKIHKIHNNLRTCIVSFDAGTKNTYENITRLGGDWDLLIENCKFLDKKNIEFPNFKINYNFVVQSDNFKEMKSYIELIDDQFPNACDIQFSMVVDWGTWPKDIYEEKCIWKDTHPMHNEFLECLKDPIFKHKKVRLGNVTNLWKKANE